MISIGIVFSEEFKKSLNTGIVIASDRSVYNLPTKNIDTPSFHILKEKKPAVVLTGCGESAILADYILNIARFFWHHDIKDCRYFKNEFPILYRQLAEMSQFYINQKSQIEKEVIVDFLLGISDEYGVGLLYYFIVTPKEFSLEELTFVPGYGVTYIGRYETLMLLEELLKAPYISPYVNERQAIEYSIFILQAVRDIIPNISPQLDVAILKKGSVTIKKDDELDVIGLKAHLHARWRATYKLLSDILEEPIIVDDMLKNLAKYR